MCLNKKHCKYFSVRIRACHLMLSKLFRHVTTLYCFFDAITSLCAISYSQCSLYISISFLCKQNRNDCGIFTMNLMEFYCPRNPTSISFSAIDIPNFRVQIAVDSVWNDYNTELETAYLISSFDLKVLVFFLFFCLHILFSWS